MSPAERERVEDQRGETISVHDRIMPIYWGDGIPLWLCNTPATVVKIGRTKIHVHFDGVSYKDGKPDAIPPRYVRRLPAGHAAG
jgi:hypothetical protein